MMNQQWIGRLNKWGVPIATSSFGGDPLVPPYQGEILVDWGFFHSKPRPGQVLLVGEYRVRVICRDELEAAYVCVFDERSAVLRVWMYHAVRFIEITNRRLLATCWIWGLINGSCGSCMLECKWRHLRVVRWLKGQE